MSSSLPESQVIELTREIGVADCVYFDPEAVKLEGQYSDQISAYRAKRVWVEALERCFLLETDADFSALVSSDHQSGKFILRCHFLTACARYAFWRLTNHQAPEAQYIIETAHIPRSESRHEDFLEAPDMRSVYDEPMVLSGDSSIRTVRTVLGRLIETITKRLGK